MNLLPEESTHISFSSLCNYQQHQYRFYMVLYIFSRLPSKQNILFPDHNYTCKEYRNPYLEKGMKVHHICKLLQKVYCLNLLNFDNFAISYISQCQYEQNLAHNFSHKLFHFHSYANQLDKVQEYT